MGMRIENTQVVPEEDGEVSRPDISESATPGVTKQIKYKQIDVGD